MSLRTPLARVRGLGSAKSGTGHFWHQRLTAVANVPLITFFIIFLIIYTGAPYASVTAALANPLVATVMALLVVSVFFHMRIGIQVVIEDYVHDDHLKLALFMLSTFFTLIVGGLCLFAILKLGFGG